MGIKLNVGISKKIGLPDYGSAGSQCNLEVELDASALDRPEEFHRRVQEAYTACRCAVEDELGNHRAGVKQDNRATPPPKTEYSSENRYPASEKQMTFISRLSKGVKGLSTQKLDDYCRATFGRVSTQLSAQEASKLIDALKEAKGGKELV